MQIFLKILRLVSVYKICYSWDDSTYECGCKELIREIIWERPVLIVMILRALEVELDVMIFYVFFDSDRFPGFYGVFYEP
jgi:hypothetical protein